MKTPEERRRIEQLNALLSELHNIHGDLRSLVELLHPYQQTEHSVGSDKTAAEPQTDPWPLGTIRVIPSVKPMQFYAFSIDITVHYDDGFGNDQTVSLCLLFELPQRIWTPSCMWVNSIDLSKDAPTATQQKQP